MFVSRLWFAKSLPTGTWHRLKPNLGRSDHIANVASGSSCSCQKLDRPQKKGLFTGAPKGRRAYRAGAGSRLDGGANRGKLLFPPGRSPRGSQSTTGREHLSSVREQFFKPPAVRSGDAVRRPPAVQRPTPAPAVEPVWSPVQLSLAISTCAPRVNNRNTI